MTSHQCAQCGAITEQLTDSCAERFNALLALDHSREEPWGSRHGSVFAAYTLQHPHGVVRESLERCWLMLFRNWIAGDDPQFVARTSREMDREHGPRGRHLGTFDASTYPDLLELWCRATLESLGQSPITAWCRSRLLPPARPHVSTIPGTAPASPVARFSCLALTAQ